MQVQHAPSRNADFRGALIVAPSRDKSSFGYETLSQDLERILPGSLPPIRNHSRWGAVAQLPGAP
jgi:hypothetical protein